MSIYIPHAVYCVCMCACSCTYYILRTQIHNLLQSEDILARLYNVKELLKGLRFGFKVGVRTTFGLGLGLDLGVSCDV